VETAVGVLSAVRVNMPACSGMLRRVGWEKLTDVSEVLTAFVIRTMMMQ
jgi:hypothetical protein